MSRKMRNGLALVLAGFTVAGVKWMFAYTEDRTMWENRYVLIGAGGAFVIGVALWTRTLLTFRNVRERARKQRIRRRWLRRRIHRLLDRRIRHVVE